ncbi:TNT domain-containing protein [Actinomadura napierensis]|uniref:TNT domain-containing protein n=1 Tax=Actinomadura napierensis TaxID=267854 RepID=A0ABP5M7C2_9ACTN
MTGQSERIAEIEERVVRFARQTAPPRWRRIDLRCAATVAASDVALTMLTGEGAVVPAEVVPDELAAMLTELRRAHYLSEQGTWFSMLAIVEPAAALFLYNDEFDPEWDPPAPLEAWRRDQIVMPRDGANVPGWLRDRLEGREPSEPAEWPAPAPLDPVEQTELLTGPFAVLVADHAPPFWERISGHYQAVGGHVEFPPMALRKADGTTEAWTPPRAAAGLLDRLRAGTHAFQGSTWSRIDVEIVYGDGAVQCRASFTRDEEPRWESEPSADDVRRELERLPRRDVPEWMARRLGPAPVSPPPPTRFESPVRKARVFDRAGTDGGPPVVSRPPVPPDEADAVIRYLEDAPAVMAARFSAPDLLDPSRGERVPLTFHTDGAWVWSGAVGYYLREHGVPPEPDLVAHMRAHGFRVPVVDDDAMDAASAAAMGRTAPRGIRTEPEPEQWLAFLQNRLDALQIDRARYRLRGEEEGTWCLLQERAGWTVFHLDNGERTRLVTFDNGENAAAYLLGSLLMVAPQQTVQIPKIQPLKGEPPLSLLRDRQFTELPAGTEVDRYGGHGGNTAYAARTPFPQRSLPADWQEREYHVYRLLRPVQALTGTAVPWFEQPGGGTAYVFERSLAYLLADGSLQEVHD